MIDIEAAKREVEKVAPAGSKFDEAQCFGALATIAKIQAWAQLEILEEMRKLNAAVTDIRLFTSELYQIKIQELMR